MKNIFNFSIIVLLFLFLVSCNLLGLGNNNNKSPSEEDKSIARNFENKTYNSFVTDSSEIKSTIKFGSLDENTWEIPVVIDNSFYTYSVKNRKINNTQISNVNSVNDTFTYKNNKFENLSFQMRCAKLLENKIFQADDIYTWQRSFREINKENTKIKIIGHYCDTNPHYDIENMKYVDEEIPLSACMSEITSKGFKLIFGDGGTDKDGTSNVVKFTLYEGDWDGLSTGN